MRQGIPAETLSEAKDLRTRALELTAKGCFLFGLGGVCLLLLLGLTDYEWWRSLPLNLIPRCRTQWVMVLFFLVGFLSWRRSGNRLRELWPKRMQVQFSDLLVTSLLAGCMLCIGHSMWWYCDDVLPYSVEPGWWPNSATRLCIVFTFLFLLSLAIGRAGGRSGPVLVGHALGSLLLKLGIMSAIGIVFLAFLWGRESPDWACVRCVLGWGWCEHGMGEGVVPLVMLRLGLFAIPLGLFLRRLACMVEPYAPSTMKGRQQLWWNAVLWLWCAGLFVASYLVLRWPIANSRWDWLDVVSIGKFRIAVLSVVLLFNGTVLCCLVSPVSKIRGPLRAAIVSIVILVSLTAILNSSGTCKEAWLIIMASGVAVIVAMAALQKQDRIGAIARALLRYGFLSVALLLLPAYLNAAGPDVTFDVLLYTKHVVLDWTRPSGGERVPQEFFWQLHHGLPLLLTGIVVLLVRFGVNRLRYDIPYTTVYEPLA